MKTALKFCIFCILMTFIFAVPATFIFIYWVFMVLLWLVIFFGACILPPGTGVVNFKFYIKYNKKIISCVPKFSIINNNNFNLETYKQLVLAYPKF